MKIYLVGGAIRDYLLNIPVHDKDWVVVGADPIELLKKNYKQVGKDFPVFLHPITFEEYALARTERKDGFGYTGFSTNYSKKITLKQDLKRRDLTINAIAQDKFGRYIDPFNGLIDLKNHVLRHVSKSFQEDPLRVLRVARFSTKLSHLGFFIHNDTLRFMKNIVKKKEILSLTSHRIWNETKKSLMLQSPHIFFMKLNDCDAFSKLFPEIYYLNKLNLKNIFFNFNSIHFNLNFRFAIFAHFCKNLDKRFSFICQFLVSFLNFNCKKKNNHFKFDFYAFLIKKMCIRLNIPTNIKNLSFIVIKYYKYFHNFSLFSSKKIVLLFNKINVWRNPNILNKLTSLIDFCPYYNIFCTCKNFFLTPSENLKIFFFITQSAPINLVLKLGVTGKLIQKKLFEIRIQLLNLYRLIILTLPCN